MPRDEDGFSSPEDFVQPLLAPETITVNIPKFFDGCISNSEAAVRMINELGKPFSVQLDGLDEFYRRIANALILILANQEGISP